MRRTAALCFRQGRTECAAKRRRAMRQQASAAGAALTRVSAATLAPVEYAVAAEAYLAAASLSESSRRVYRISLTSWAWPLVGRPWPEGRRRRGAAPPIVALALLDSAGTGARLAAAMAARAKATESGPSTGNCPRCAPGAVAERLPAHRPGADVLPAGGRDLHRLHPPARPGGPGLDPAAAQARRAGAAAGVMHLHAGPWTQIIPYCSPSGA
jgi:hypothetical protein